MNASCDPEKPRRRSIRLRDYDYSRAGAYFITVCTKGQRLLFGEVNDGEVELNESGRIAEEEWLNSARIRIEIKMDTWIVMPNHVHGIVIIDDKRRRGARPGAR
ncbi:MAG: transposase, partial [Candidatus Latescibacteria bacterium]|nr:transposase [Candidatus Latescibacterota bacterium]